MTNKLKKLKTYIIEICKCKDGAECQQQHAENMNETIDERTVSMQQTSRIQAIINNDTDTYRTLFTSHAGIILLPELVVSCK